MINGEHYRNISTFISSEILKNNFYRKDAESQSAEFTIFSAFITS